MTDVAGTIQRELRRRIASGAWSIGSQAPTERALSDEFGVARNTVRRALRDLEADGLVHRRVGRGTFVVATADERGFDARLRDAGPAEVMEVRLVLEPQAAALAASRASAGELAAIETALRQSLAAKGIAEFEAWDARLHLAVATATQNRLLLELCRTIGAAREQPRWYQLKKRSLSPDKRTLYDRQHTALVAALRERDGEAAARHMREHLLAVQQALVGGVV
jgi:DNA-binding FadR family transcriptional regulator